MINLSIKNETSSLKAVVLGRGDSFGGKPREEDIYDPKSLEYLRAGTFPKEKDIVFEMNAFKEVLEKHGVQVFRPDLIEGLNQVFSRDIGFVIEDKFIVPNIIDDRKEEQSGLNSTLQEIDGLSVVHAPEGSRLEGGDVMPWNGKLYIGYSEEEDFEKYKVSRTNKAGVQFLTETFPSLEVHAFELSKSDTIANENALHLDCCFQPIGYDQAIVYKGGFKNESDYQYLIDTFGSANCLEITQDEMYKMFSNVFSISPEVVVSERGFTRLNDELRKRGFVVEEIPYFEISKMEGLLRCSTLPLQRI